MNEIEAALVYADVVGSGGGGGGGSKPITLKASFKNTTPANAEGEIVLTASNSGYSGDYDVMWGDANGVMSNYSKIDTITLDVANNKSIGSIKMMEYNAIPKYATRLCAVKNGEIVASFNIPAAKLWNNTYYGEHLYSYGAISDVHIQYDSGENDVRVCLTYLNERESVEAVCIAGDLTSDGTVTSLEEWKTARDAYCDGTPVYSCVGNHESNMMNSNPNGIRKYLDSDWVNETLPYFHKVINNDVFVFMSAFEGTTQRVDHTMISNAQMTWLEGILEQYRNQRIFLFFHVPPHWNTPNGNGAHKYNGFGNGNGAYSYDLWGNPQVENRPLADRTDFLNLLDHYKNVIWFNGHSHIKYEYQKLWDELNVMQYKGGARFVHLASLTVPRDIINGTVGDQMYAESEGTVVDVYPNHIRLRSRNFVSGKFYGLCEYLIDTTPVTIPPSSKTLVSISATKTKTSYYTDESSIFTTSDITVTATWSDSTTSVVNNSDVTFNTSTLDWTSAGNYSIGISYTYGDVTETTSVTVTLAERPLVKTLRSISATKTKTAYQVNESLSTADITVMAEYSDDTTADVTASAIFDTQYVDMTSAGSYTIGVSYTEDGVTKTTSVSVTVSSLNPTVILDATFSGSVNAGDEIGATSATVGHTSSAGAYAQLSDSSGASGKTLYYRLISDTGVNYDVRIGYRIGTGANASTLTNKIKSYTATESAWTKLVTSDNAEIHMDSTNKYLNVRCGAAATSSATFPITLNTRIQIGYV